MIYRTTIVTAVVLLMVVGCAPAEDGADGDRPAAGPTLHTIRAEAYVDGNGAIDYKEDHPTVVLRPRDRVRWVCDCPAEIQFAITEPEARLDLEKLESVIIRDDWNQEAVEELIRGLSETPAATLQETPQSPAREAGQGENSVTRAREFLERIAPALPMRPKPGQQPPRLFDGDVPRAFVDADGAIPSPAVRANPGHRFWKFSWKFRVGGGPAEQDCPVKDEPHFRCWDPHLISDDF